MEPSDALHCMQPHLLLKYFCIEKCIQSPFRPFCIPWKQSAVSIIRQSIWPVMMIAAIQHPSIIQTLFVVKSKNTWGGTSCGHNVAETERLVPCVTLHILSHGCHIITSRKYFSNVTFEVYFDCWCVLDFFSQECIWWLCTFLKLVSWVSCNTGCWMHFYDAICEKKHLKNIAPFYIA